jgi:hypothetical protein
MIEEDHKFEVKLPTRITGLVFWGLVFVGLLLAVLILHNAEQDLITENNKNTLLVSYKLEEIFEEYSDPPVLEKASGRLRDGILSNLDEFGFHAARITEGDETISIGEIMPDDDIYNYTLHYYPLNERIAHEVYLELYCMNTADAISDIRKKFLLSIGFGVLIRSYQAKINCSWHSNAPRHLRSH